MCIRDRDERAFRTQAHAAHTLYLASARDLPGCYFLFQRRLDRFALARLASSCHTHTHGVLEAALSLALGFCDLFQFLRRHAVSISRCDCGGRVSSLCQPHLCRTQPLAPSRKSPDNALSVLKSGHRAWSLPVQLPV